MTETQQLSDLLRDLAGALVDKPEAIRVATQAALDGTSYWAVKGDPEDESKLVGRDGSHVNALRLVVQEIGRANGKVYTFRLITDNDARARPPGNPRDVLEYDPRPARDLLCRILAELELAEFAVEVGPGAGPRNSLRFDFAVRVKEAADYSELLKPRRLVLREGSARAEEVAVEMPIVDALGTLFRAIAKRAGVRFQINVVKP